MTKTITIAAIIGAFILGTGAFSLVDASPASDAALIAALGEIRDAVLGIDPNVTVEPTVNVDVPPAEVQIIGIEGPQGPPGILGPEFVDEVDARIAGDNTLQFEIDSEEQARIAGDNTLQFEIDSEEQARIAGDNILDVSKQDRVFDFCTVGQSIRVINEDGTVVCEADSDTNYTAGHGLNENSGAFAVDTVEIQSRVSGICPAGESIRVINEDGAVVCEAVGNAISTYTKSVKNTIDTSLDSTTFGTVLCDSGDKATGGGWNAIQPNNAYDTLQYAFTNGPVVINGDPTGWQAHTKTTRTSGFADTTVFVICQDLTP